MNAAIAGLLDVHYNKNFLQRPVSRRTLFEQEGKPLLSLLPAERYELKWFKEVTLMKNGHILLSEGKYYYSVPYRYIGCRVKIIFSATAAAIFYNKERVALPCRSSKQYGRSAQHYLLIFRNLYQLFASCPPTKGNSLVFGERTFVWHDLQNSFWKGLRSFWGYAGLDSGPLAWCLDVLVACH